MAIGMFGTFWSRLCKLCQFVWPGQEERSALRKIRASGRFDKGFYLAVNPGLRWVFRMAPLRHYVTIGERNGLCPMPTFSPVAYRAGRPGPRSVSAFCDFLADGPTGPSIAPAESPPDLSGWLGPQRRNDYAVVLHLYYAELWDEIARHLERIEIAFDLLVSLGGAAAGPGGVGPSIRKVVPAARIVEVPNRGRDILPFVLAANHGILQEYRAVAKIHGKVSPHLATGAAWRRSLLAGLLAEDCGRQLAAFEASRKALLWAADDSVLEGDRWWSANRPRAAALYGKALPDRLAFAAGAMFWAKPALIDRLAALNLQFSDFEPEAGFIDGTTAHAVERVFGVLALEAGGQIVQSRDLANERLPFSIALTADPTKRNADAGSLLGMEMGR